MSATPAPPRRGLSTGAAARLVGVSRWAITRAIKAGALPAWRFDRGPWRVRLEDVRALVRRGPAER